MPNTVPTLSRSQHLHDVAMNVDPLTLPPVVQRENYLFPISEIMEYREKEINMPPDDEDTPVWARWKAQASNGSWSWFEVMPTPDSIRWSPPNTFLKQTAGSGVLPEGHDWKDTLQPVHYELDWDGTGNPPKKTRCEVSVNSNAYQPAIIIAYHDDYVWLELKTSQSVRQVAYCNFRLISNDESATIRQMAIIMSPNEKPQGYKTMARRIYQAISFNKVNI